MKKKNLIKLDSAELIILEGWGCMRVTLQVRNMMNTWANNCRYSLVSNTSLGLAKNSSPAPFPS